MGDDPSYCPNTIGFLPRIRPTDGGDATKAQYRSEMGVFNIRGGTFSDGSGGGVDVRK